MKAWIVAGLSAVIGLAAVHAFAQDVAWRPAGAAQAFQRVNSSNEPTVTLSRPVPLGATQDAPVQETIQLDHPTPIFRAKALDNSDLPRLMPLGPTQSKDNQPGSAKPMGGPEVLGMPRVYEKFDVLSPHPDSCGLPGLTSGIEDCVVCDVACDECGDCLGGRLRDRFRLRCREWGGCCEDPCCLPRPNRWVRGEFLVWSITDQQLPPLLIGAPAFQTSAPVLLGDSNAQYGSGLGGRVQLGFWLPRRCNWGLDGSFFMMSPYDFRGAFDSDALGNPFFARPAVDATGAGGEPFERVSTPGETAGWFMYESRTRVWGADFNVRRKLNCGPRWWLDGFVGYRHLSVNDTIDMREQIDVIGFQPGYDTRTIVGHDHFATRNSFNGVQLGIEGELKVLRRWFLAGNAKLAAGNVNQVINISGETLFVDSPNGTVPGIGGTFALASNIGRHERNEFGIVSEFGIKVGRDITDNLRVYAGYNLLYLSDVARAGEQIDIVINKAMQPTPDNRVPGQVAPLRPAVLFRTNDFWAQGGQIGLEYHW